MDRISDVAVVECKESQYIKPIRLRYIQNEEAKSWDIPCEHDDVCILLYNKSRDVLLFVMQFRPAVYLNRSEITNKNEAKFVDTKKFPGSLGMTYELCAGIVDKDCSLAEIAQAEVFEECGYKVPLDGLQKVSSYRSGVGTSGSVQTLYYAEVTDDMKVGHGGGQADEGEMIEVVEVPVSEGKTFMMDESKIKPVDLMFALLWFYENKAPKKYCS